RRPGQGLSVLTRPTPAARPGALRPDPPPSGGLVRGSPSGPATPPAAWSGALRPDPPPLRRSGRGLSVRTRHPPGGYARGSPS
ncbi:MAG: hypothetical protein LBT40_08425, partial [Deltaproteobacteria bacterium]|nr:hypothetical protein [Deltaproteobacteria bacterium]